MQNKHFLRGMATVNYWAEDVVAARNWYAALFGVEAYFQRPNAEHPAYVEFRIGDYEHEFGIIDRKYAPTAMQPGPGAQSSYGMLMISRQRLSGLKPWGLPSMIQSRNVVILVL